MGFWDGSGIRWTICKQSAPLSRQITTPTPHHSIFTGWMLFLMPNQWDQSTECTNTNICFTRITQQVRVLQRVSENVRVMSGNSAVPEKWSLCCHWFAAWLIVSDNNHSKFFGRIDSCSTFFMINRRKPFSCIRLGIFKYRQLHEITN